jgi:hypothetical protein
MELEELRREVGSVPRIALAKVSALRCVNSHASTIFFLHRILSYLREFPRGGGAGAGGAFALAQAKPIAIPTFLGN